MITLWWSTETTQRQPEGGDTIDMTVERLDLDVLEQAERTVEAKVTAHPVEQGAPITDFVIRQQERITLRVVVSDSPATVHLVDGTEIGDGGIIQAPESTRRTVDVLRQLQQLAEDGTSIDVDGLRINVEGWIIAKVSAPWKAESKGALELELEIVEVLYAETEEVEAPAPRVERARRHRQRGSQNGNDTGSTDTPSSEPQDRQSALATIYDQLTGG